MLSDVTLFLLQSSCELVHRIIFDLQRRSINDGFKLTDFRCWKMYPILFDSLIKTMTFLTKVMSLKHVTCTMAYHHWRKHVATNYFKLHQSVYVRWRWIQSGMKMICLFDLLYLAQQWLQWQFLFRIVIFSGLLPFLLNYKQKKLCVR